jgi:hypothetical protein
MRSFSIVGLITALLLDGCSSATIRSSAPELGCYSAGFVQPSPLDMRPAVSVVFRLDALVNQTGEIERRVIRGIRRPQRRADEPVRSRVLPQLLDASALVPAGSELFLSLSPRPRATWVDGIPTYDADTKHLGKSFACTSRRPAFSPQLIS